ncbi:uncharacterized protein LOC105895406 [Clupea harengus]|uniref:Uncharacterized protein LOC105895406 n=1 Tax=Clupea harengus TaxID=7950 RepID=A0A6P8GN31_CLUHA|nr:uncharacterized protein LOC105895406 [Clupea harengus]
MHMCDVVYLRRFGLRFLRTIVTAFRQVSRNRMDSVETDLDLEFNETSTEPLPQSSEVVETLVNAVNDNSSGFNVDVRVDSIVVTSAPNSTGIPQFRTNETFTADLLNSTSDAFRTRSSLLKRELEPFFFEDFQPDFISLTPRSFSNGSIIHMTDINVPFNTTFPNDAQIIATLTRAALSGNLSITITFINGTGRQTCYSSKQGLIIEGETVQ